MPENELNSTGNGNDLLAESKQKKTIRLVSSDEEKLLLQIFN